MRGRENIWTIAQAWMQPTQSPMAKEMPLKESIYMDPRLTAIADLIKNTQKTIDDLAWENNDDPRITGLIKQLNEYKDKAERGEVWEPNF